MARPTPLSSALILWIGGLLAFQAPQARGEGDSQLPFQSARCDRLLSTPAFPAVDHALLTDRIRDKMTEVAEFRYLRETCEQLRIRCWLFGGTAAGFAHYVKWDWLRSNGGPEMEARLQPDRFDYDYTNIYRSTQDADLVIDGTAEQAADLERRLSSVFPYLQGSKSVWEVRLLRESRGDKEALLENPDFLNQHTDSNSTGLIEVTVPGSSREFIRDLRDWNPEAGQVPNFLKDVAEGRLHYYHSPTHGQTPRALEGKNPPILSVIRYLTKAFQYELALRDEDLATIRTLIREFHPQRDSGNPYVEHWIQKNGKKLIQHAVNIEYAWNTLDHLGLRQKLMAFGGVDSPNSLAWWVNREPLRARSLGEGTGKTARELGITVVAHETRDFLAYESITRAHTGDPNVFISREHTPGEHAHFGRGFYVAVGRTGAMGTGLTIRFEMNPEARLGTDFDFAYAARGHDTPANDGEYLLIHNKHAMRVIQESVTLGAHGYFQALIEGNIDPSDRALFEKFKRRLHRGRTRDASLLNPEDLERAAALVDEVLEKTGGKLFRERKIQIGREFFEFARGSDSLSVKKTRAKFIEKLIRIGEYGESDPFKATGFSYPFRGKVIETLRAISGTDAPLFHRSVAKFLEDLTAPNLEDWKKRYAAEVLTAIAPQDPAVQSTLISQIQLPLLPHADAALKALESIHSARGGLDEARLEELRRKLLEVFASGSSTIDLAGEACLFPGLFSGEANHELRIQLILEGIRITRDAKSAPDATRFQVFWGKFLSFFLNTPFDLRGDERIAAALFAGLTDRPTAIASLLKLTPLRSPESVDSLMAAIDVSIGSFVLSDIGLALFRHPLEEQVLDRVVRILSSEVRSKRMAAYDVLDGYAIRNPRIADLLVSNSLKADPAEKIAITRLLHRWPEGQDPRIDRILGRP